MRDGHHAGARVEQLLVLFEEQLAAVVHGNHAQLGALFFAQHLPRHDVGVVLHGGDDDLVALFDVLAAPGTGDQVDAFGGAADEDQLVGGRGIQEMPGLDARLFVGRGGALAQFVHAAMDVGAIHLVEMADGVDHHGGLLRGGGAIQVDQRLAVNRLLEDREILADFFDVETGVRLR